MSEKSAADPFWPYTFLEFPDHAFTSLEQADARMGALMRKIGPISRRAYPGAFCGLLHAITSQQISGKARDAIWSRIVAAHAPLSPRKICGLKAEQLTACGLSSRKAAYAQNLAQAFDRGDIREKELENLPDDKIAQLLTPLPGIGAWTVEMALIFTFRRPNVLSADDLGIRKGISLLYGLPRPDAAMLRGIAARYAPWATLASLYLWELAGNAKILAEADAF